MSTTDTVPAPQLPFERISHFKLGGRPVLDNLPREGRGMYLVPIDRIIVREGFNQRVDMGNTDLLADQILKYGQLLPCFVDVLEDGNFLLIDGERRYLANCVLRDRGHQNRVLKCLPSARGTTDKQRLEMMFLTQDNKQFTQTEKAAWFAVMVESGLKQKEIAELTGTTDAYVSQMLSFNKESDEVKDMVIKGEISAANVVRLQKKIPDQDQRTNHIIKSIQCGINPMDLHDEIPLQEDDELAPLQNSGSAQDEDDFEISKHDNTKYSTRHEEIDNEDNSHGPAYVLPNNNNAGVGEENRKAAIKSKRERLEQLSGEIQRKFDLDLDGDEQIELYDLLASYY